MEFSIVKEKDLKLVIKSGNSHSLTITHGEGNYLYDINGKAYLDLSANACERNFGYQDLMNDYAAEKALELSSISGRFNNSVITAVTTKLLSNTCFNRAALTLGLLEAQSMAGQLIKSYHKNRNKIVIATDKAHDFFSSAKFDMEFVELNDLAALKKSVTEETAAFIFEPVWIDSGVRKAEYDYLVNAYAHCKALDVLVVCDESYIGFGRTGSKFVYEMYGIQPEIVTISKGLSCGFSMGAVLTRNVVSDGFKPDGMRIDDRFNLFSLSMAELMLDKFDDKLLEENIKKGDYLLSKLFKTKKHNFVLDVRGKGLIAAIELSGRIVAAKIASQMEKAGFLIDVAAGNVLRFTPPFSITYLQIDEACDALSTIFAETNI